MDTFLCLAPPAHIIQSFISIIRRIKPNRSICVPNKVHKAIQSKGICLSLHFKLHGPFNTTFRNSCSLALGCILFEECVYRNTEEPKTSSALSTTGMEVHYIHHEQVHSSLTTRSTGNPSAWLLACVLDTHTSTWWAHCVSEGNLETCAA